MLPRIGNPLMFQTPATSSQRMVVPEAAGKAAAFDRWIAQSGNLDKKSGTYTKGPMRGKTYNEAMQKFELMWGSASGAIKDKYAARARSGLSPSEKLEQGLAPQPPADQSPAAQQKRRMASYGFDKAPDGTVKRIGTPVIQPYDRDANGVPDSIQRPASVPVAAAATVPVVNQPTPQASAPAAPQPNPNEALDRMFPGIAVMEGRKPASIVTPAATPAPAPTPAAPPQPAPQPVASTPAPAPQSPPPARMPRINRLTGMPFGANPGETQGMTPDQVATANRMQQERAAQGAPSARPSDIKGADNSMREMGLNPPPPPRIGKPVKPPTYLEKSQINRPRTVVTDTVEGRAAQELRRQNEINRNPSTVNPPGMRLVGPKIPLDKLVKKQRQRLGTPARG